MLKNINKFLKYVGLNLIHAKRVKVKEKRAGYRRHAQIEDAKTGATCVAEFKNDETHRAGCTHYVGDDCPGGHKDTFKHVDASPTQDNNITGPTS